MAMDWCLQVSFANNTQTIQQQRLTHVSALPDLVPAVGVPYEVDRQELGIKKDTVLKSGLALVEDDTGLHEVFDFSLLATR